MKGLLGGGAFLLLLGIIYYLPQGTYLLNHKTLSKMTGLILMLLGGYMIFRALTL